MSEVLGKLGSFMITFLGLTSIGTMYSLPHEQQSFNRTGCDVARCTVSVHVSSASWSVTGTSTHPMALLKHSLTVRHASG